jgi:uncharacterized 2Fe-2S/4Fe-4S cluster protein (DUF4445 family)
MILGLIPDCDLAQVQPVGNAAGDGARMMLLDKNTRTEAQWAARWVTYIETAVEPAFQDEFVSALDLPHAADPFPHLADVLETARAQWSPDRLAAFDVLANNGRGGRASREDRAARRAQRAQRKQEATEFSL